MKKKTPAHEMTSEQLRAELVAAGKAVPSKLRKSELQSLVHELRGEKPSDVAAAKHTVKRVAATKPAPDLLVSEHVTSETKRARAASKRASKSDVSAQMLDELSAKVVGTRALMTSELRDELKKLNVPIPRASRSREALQALLDETKRNAEIARDEKRSRRVNPKAIKATKRDREALVVYRERPGVPSVERFLLSEHPDTYTCAVCGVSKRSTSFPTVNSGQPNVRKSECRSCRDVRNGRTEAQVGHAQQYGLGSLLEGMLSTSPPEPGRRSKKLRRVAEMARGDVIAELIERGVSFAPSTKTVRLRVLLSDARKS